MDGQSRSARPPQHPGSLRSERKASDREPGHSSSRRNGSNNHDKHGATTRSSGESVKHAWAQQGRDTLGCSPPCAFNLFAGHYLRLWCCGGEVNRRMVVCLRVVGLHALRLVGCVMAAGCAASESCARAGETGRDSILGDVSGVSTARVQATLRALESEKVGGP